MDIRPPQPTNKPTPKPNKQQPAEGAPLKVPEELLESGKKEPLLSAHASEPKRFSKKRIILVVLIVLAVLAAASVGWANWWYNNSLEPKSSSNERIKVVIETGATPGQIADELEQKGVIKSAFAFNLLVKNEGDRDKLQAGTYLFSPKQSSREVLDWLVEGKVDTFNVTILPGLTLAEIKQYLIKDGFKAADIDAAYKKTYNHPLLASKPATVNLEGYIYPETYQISSETPVEDLLMHSFDLFYRQIQAKGLEEELKARGFNLHQGITLASIIGREVSNSNDKRQVAQVFEKRLKEGIELGSDVTYMYAAKLTGQTPSPSLDSPYNTRRVKGLPPGAIANFNIDSLEAVADPVPGDYLYFVAGDDGTTHFAKTEAEHEANVKQYCTKLCSE